MAQVLKDAGLGDKVRLCWLKYAHKLQARMVASLSAGGFEVLNSRKSLKLWPRGSIPRLSRPKQPRLKLSQISFVQLGEAMKLISWRQWLRRWKSQWQQKRLMKSRLT